MVRWSQLGWSQRDALGQRTLPPSFWVFKLDCPKSGPGLVQSFFAGPGPGPLGLGRHVLDLDRGQGVRARSSPGPDLAPMEKC